MELYIDAEYSHLQPAVRLITLALMLQYNAKFPIVFNTYQCYLKQSLSALASDIALSENSNFYFGCKIVRGGNLLKIDLLFNFGNKICTLFPVAYLSAETKRFQELNASLFPIHDSYENTNASYNK